MVSLAAWLLSTIRARSIGSVAWETRRTSRRRPPSRTTKASGPKPSTGSPFPSTALTNAVPSRVADCALTFEPDGNVAARIAAMTRADEMAMRIGTSLGQYRARC